MAGLNVLLGVVPGAASVGHEHGHGKAGDRHAAQQTHHAGGAQDDAGGQGDDDGQQGGNDHLMECALGAQGHAGGVVRVGSALHDAGDLTERAAALHYDGLGGPLHGTHSKSGEYEGEHSSDEQAYKDCRAGQIEVEHLGSLGLDDVHIGHQQGKSGEGG